VSLARERLLIFNVALFDDDALAYLPLSLPEEPAWSSHFSLLQNSRNYRGYCTYSAMICLADGQSHCRSCTMRAIIAASGDNKFPLLMHFILMAVIGSRRTNQQALMEEFGRLVHGG